MLSWWRYGETPVKLYKSIKIKNGNGHKVYIIEGIINNNEKD